MKFKNLIPWRFSGIDPFLSTYGDFLFFHSIQKTPSIETNPDAQTSIHTIVPHRYLNAFLLAIKSFLRFYSDVAVYVHDDGSLTSKDIDIIKEHIKNVIILKKSEADRYFNENINDPFLSKVRSSYTSYLKLFDPAFRSKSERIMLLDTDTLFLKRPDSIIEWVKNGGDSWYHLAPRGNMKIVKDNTNTAKPSSPHIQTLIMEQLDEINAALSRNYKIEQGFCAGFIGYNAKDVNLVELKALLTNLHNRFADRIFKWGSEQTIHGLILCGNNANPLPIEDYFVYTQNNANSAKNGTFIHFVGENRFYKMNYPRFARNVIQSMLSDNKNK
ncbi:hypothetical protein [Methylotuvimicrobium sp.]|uniref:hypothetical protein n=1 Tax=Methylotuvimicrobium sp. TaxID=2822413 RepID=UPI003D64EA7D